MSQNLLTTKEVAERFQLSEASIRVLIKSDQIPHVILGGSIRFDPQHLDLWIQDKKKGQ